MKGSFIEPSVFLLAESRIHTEGHNEFLDFLGVPDWVTDAASDAEKLVETAGKLCYMSFSTDLNKNLTRVGGRNNFDYIQKGIVATEHGSVLEHATITLAFMNVSRIVTHEMVRHRAGAAYSQVSGRYVRTDSVDMYLPSDIKDNPEAVAIFEKANGQMEENVLELARIFKIDEMKTPGEFNLKKILTSAFRRLIGNGQANHLLATYNHRSLRHIIPLRTSQHAEEEIRLTWWKAFLLVKDKFPAIYGDVKISDPIRGIPEVTFEFGAV